MKCDFEIIVKDILEDGVDDYLAGVSVAIVKGSDVLHIRSCDGFLL